MTSRRRSLLALVLVALGLLAGCNKGPPPTETSDASATTATPSPAVTRGIRLVKAPPGADVAEIVRTERQRERAAGRELLVYAGAPWCEPCQHFHEAAKAGELDEAFPNLTLLEFDVDVDRDRLVRAGYRSELIPLFVRPGDDGRASERKLQGSVKGKAAVANITPRLRALLAP